MTADLDAPGRDRAGLAQIVRQRLSRLGKPAIALIALLAVVEVVHGFRVIGTPWQGGDLLYHGALANEILHGELPPDGPYAGMPTYYPPGFHFMLAATMATLGLDQVRADQLLTLLWLPVLPLGTFLLTRRLTSRPWVAVLAAAVTCFGGGYVLVPGRLWVNSLFMIGQEAYPLYPRDVVFALLPFGILAFLRACEPGATRRVVWALGAGVVFGVAALVQIQLLLPLPLAMALTAAVIAIRRPEARRASALAVAVTGLVAAAFVAPWLIDQLQAIGRNGGVALDSSDTLEPARFGFWSYPLQFGLILPLAVVGSGLALLFLRRTSGTLWVAGPSSWLPRPREGLLLLVAWAALAFGLGVLYRPDWPLEDALRPQRMWLLASQPMAILAAIGLVAVAEHNWTRRRPHPRWLVAAAMLVIVVPTTVATVRLLRSTWDRATYADLDIVSDRVPAFGSLLGELASGQTILTYEDWSALAWFGTGSKIVAMVPPGFAKLAYDPATFTGHGQAERRADVSRAFSGDDRMMTAVADKYGARTMILARRGQALGTVDLPATILAAEPGAVAGSWALVEGNGWDAVSLESGSRLRVPVPAGPIRVEVRLVEPDGPAQLSGTATTMNGAAIPVSFVRGPGDRPGWLVMVASFALPSDGTLELVATNPLSIQSMRAFVDGNVAPPGWRIVNETTDAAVLERVP